MADLLVMGTGLIGTSIGLAVRGSRDVVLSDLDAASVLQAAGRGAGRAWDGREPVEHAVVAASPGAVPGILHRLQQLGVAQTYSHVSSVQSRVQAEVEALNCDLTSLCGSHPMAGKEQSGPAAANADLFAGRPWVVCASPATSGGAREAVTTLAEETGAVPVHLSASKHDQAVAAVSHLPHVVAVALAGVLLDVPDAQLDLASSGLRDTTRVAASPTGMWVDVLTRNAAELLPLLDAVIGRMQAIRGALEPWAGATGPRSSVSDGDDGDVAAEGVLRALLEQGRSGRARVPVKGRQYDDAFAEVAVLVPDRPGQLAGLLVSAAQAGINVEDVRVDHVPGRPQGVIELVVHAASVEAAAGALRAQGWDVRS